MAEILPKSPVVPVRSEVGKVFKALKDMPGADFRCRWALPVHEEKRPEFLIIYKEQNAFLIEVSSVSDPAAEELIQPSLCGLLAPSRLTLENFAAEEEVVLARFGEGISPTVVRIVAFPNVRQRTLDQIGQRNGSRFVYLGKENVTRNSLGPVLASLAAQPISSAEVNLLRSCFSPEVSSPVRLSLPHQRPEILRQV